MHEPQRQLSLVKPTGHLTLGNLLGALRPMREATAYDECFYGIADLHALTITHDARTLNEQSREVSALMLASGLDPDACTLFIQSHVPAHAELSYLLECTATTGELNRMIQFKEKGRGTAETRVSLYTYPALMAADILLYGAAEVPVGDDQRQHVELTRNLAERFNHRYAEPGKPPFPQGNGGFVVPKAVHPTMGARVMDLQEPTRKMGKSHASGAGIIYLLDDPSTVRKKVKRAVTDSGTEVRHDRENKPGVSNLLEIIAACTGRKVDEVAAESGSYGALKNAAADAVLEVLEPVQKTYAELDEQTVSDVFEAGSQHARDVTAPVLAAAKTAIGLA